MTIEFKFAQIEDLEDYCLNFLPIRADEKSTGWDVKCALPSGILLYPFEHCLIPLGFRVLAPAGYWLELRPRSSAHAKKHLNCLYGVIDESFEGECFLSAQYIPTSIDESDKEPAFIDFGERIGQIIPVRRLEMKVTGISNDEYDAECKKRGATRGSGGFGSTGK